MNTSFWMSPRKLLAKVHQSYRVLNFVTIADDTKHSRKAEALDLAYSVYDDHHLSSVGNTPLIITHGLLGSKSNWHSLAKSLNKLTKRKIVTFDLRGHGDSPHSTEMDYDVMKEDIFRLLNTLSITKANILGHSLGGRAVMTFTLNYPQLVDRLICVDISPVHRQSQNPAVFLYEMAKIEFDSAHSLAQARKYADQKLAAVVEDVAIRQFLLTNVTKDANGVRWRCNVPNLISNTFNFFNMQTAGKKFEGPSLFISGGKSNYILKEDHDTIRGTFPNAEFHSIPEAGHWVHADKPQDFIAEVVRFLT